MIINLETAQYSGNAAFKEYDDFAILCYKKQARTLPIGQEFEINGAVWTVKGTKASPYVEGLVNVRLEKVT